jgi:prepilin-type N-terminal cleavage/methylation domain-containing protein
MKKAASRSVRAVRGFTLIELMVVVAIAAIITALALPSFNAMIAKNKVKAAAEDIYGLVLQVKTEAPIREPSLSINAMPAATPWCIGGAENPGCDCSNTTSCTLPTGTADVLQVVNGNDHPDVTLTEPAVEDGVTFNSTRGETDAPFTVTVTSGEWELSIEVNAQGRIKLCNPNSNNIPGYEGC